ncbi:MAG TPA: TetR/AcrR family transcriptional regulator [Anaerolineae bacterium]|nr:TetR/AcrR family transcriptional regulator [Anaerolineae bacterium]
MAKPNRRELRRQEVRQSILDAARTIVKKGGIENLNMRAIAKAIKYSPSGLYGYFDSKQALIEAIATQGYERLAEYLLAVEKTPQLEKYLTELGLAYVTFARENPDYYVIMFTTVPSTEAVLEIRAEGSVFDFLLRTIEEAVNTGVFRTHPNFGVRQMTYATWAHVHGIAMLQVTFLSNPDILSDLHDRAAIEAFFRGLTI